MDRAQLAERVAYFFFLSTPASSRSDHNCSHTASGGRPVTPLAAQWRAASARHWIASARTAESSTLALGGRGVVAPVPAWVRLTGAGGGGSPRRRGRPSSASLPISSARLFCSRRTCVVLTLSN